MTNVIESDKDNKRISILQPPKSDINPRLKKLVENDIKSDTLQRDYDYETVHKYYSNE